MPNYRRRWIAGGCYFFTVTLADRRSDLLTMEIATLRDAVRKIRGQRPFDVNAWVVLPDHMHCVWTLPDGDHDYAGRWRALKTEFTKRLGTASPWQTRYWEHTIRDAADDAAHVDYVHFNPVKHGYVTHAADWPYSTFRRAVAAGMYPAGWAGPTKEPDETGES